MVIGSQTHYCVLFKKFYPIFLIGRSGFFLKKSKKRFEDFGEDIIRVSRDYQFLKIDEDIYIKDLENYVNCICENKGINLVFLKLYYKEKLEND